MDGNGRWATARGLSRTAGHRAGVEVVRRVVEAAPSVFIVINPEGEAWWIAARLLAASYVVAMGVMTGLYLRAATPSAVKTELLLLGAIGLLALGAAGAVWGFHVAEVTGDLEAWAT